MYLLKFLQRTSKRKPLSSCTAHALLTRPQATSPHLPKFQQESYTSSLVVRRCNNIYISCLNVISLQPILHLQVLLRSVLQGLCHLLTLSTFHLLRPYKSLVAHIKLWIPQLSLYLLRLLLLKSLSSPVRCARCT